MDKSGKPPKEISKETQEEILAERRGEMLETSPETPKITQIESQEEILGKKPGNPGRSARKNFGRISGRNSGRISF